MSTAYPLILPQLSGRGGGSPAAGGPPIALADNFGTIQVDTGVHIFDVLANDDWDPAGTPVLSIDSQSGPGTFFVQGTGAASELALNTAGLTPSGGSQLQQCTYRLAEGAHPDATATASVLVIGPAPTAVDDPSETAELGGDPIEIDVTLNDSFNGPKSSLFPNGAADIDLTGTLGVAVPNGAGNVIYTPPESGGGTSPGPLPHVQLSGASFFSDPNITGLAPDWAITGSDGVFDSGISFVADGSGSLRFQEQFSNGGTTFVSDFIDITPGADHVVSMRMFTENVADNWPGTISIILTGAEGTGGGGTLHTNFKSMFWANSNPGIWEECLLAFRAHDGGQDLASVQVKMLRREGHWNLAGGAGAPAGRIWFDDMWLRPHAPATRAAPPIKRAFTGAGKAVTIDDLGNIQVGGQPFFIFGIYTDKLVIDSFARYSDVGFNVDMWAHSDVRLQLCQDAVSSFNPNGMMGMLATAQWWNTTGFNFNDTANFETRLSDMLVPGLIGNFFGYNEDFENSLETYYVIEDFIQGAGSHSIDTLNPDGAGGHAHPVYQLMGDWGGIRPYAENLVDAIGTYVRPQGRIGGVVSQVEWNEFLIHRTEGITAPHLMQQWQMTVGAAAGIPDTAGALRLYLYASLIEGNHGGFSIWQDGGPAADITTQAWYSTVAGLRTEIEALLAAGLIQTPHWVNWTLAQTGATGTHMSWGARNLNGELCLIVLNADEAAGGSVTIDLTDLEYTPQQLVTFPAGDFVANIVGDSVTITLPALGASQGTGVYRVTGLAGASPGDDTFDYTITDGSGLSDTATVTVALTAPAAGAQIIGGAGAAKVATSGVLQAAKPVALQVGDEMYLQLAIWSSVPGSQSVQPLAVWTEVAEQTTDPDIRQWVFHRQATVADVPGETIDIDWSADNGAGGQNTRIAIARCSAVRGHTPEELVGASEAGAGTSITAPDINAAAGSKVLAFVAHKVSGDTEPTVGEITAESTGDWTKVQEFVSPTSILGQRAKLVLYEGTGPQAGGAATSSISGPWSAISLAAGTSQNSAPPATLPDFDVTILVSDHGAVGDGTNEASNLQAAINAAEAYRAANPTPVVGNRVGIVFGAGLTYRVGSKLTMQNENFIYLIGNGATIKRRDDWVLGNTNQGRMFDVLDCPDCGMYDLTMDGNVLVARTDLRQHCLQCRKCDRWESRRCTYIGIQGDGCSFTRAAGTIVGNPNWADMVSDTYLFEDCQFLQASRNCMSNEYGINGTWRRCLFSGGGHGNSPHDPRAGLDVEPLERTGGVPQEIGAIVSRNHLIDQCTFENNAALGLKFSGGSSEIRDVVIQNCIFRDNGQNGHNIKKWNGHLEFDGMTVGIKVFDSEFYDLTVAPDPAVGWKTAIYIKHPRSPDVEIRRCNFANNTGCTTLIEERHIAESTRNVVIADCDFDVTTGLRQATSSSASTGRCPIACCWSNTTITGNIIRGLRTGGFSTTGIKFDGPGGAKPDGAEATNNDIRDCVVGIHIIGGANGAGAGHGINTTSPANAFTNCGTNIQDDT